MPTVFDSLKPMSFGGIAFPYQDLKVVGGIRDHIHEFPHVSGGAPEKLGRKLYEISVTAQFQAGLASKAYPHLWPNDIASMRAMFEAQTTAKLHIPTIGTIDAYCVAWTESAKATNRSGVTADLTFKEDQSGDFLVENQRSLIVEDYSSALSAFQSVPRPAMSQTSGDIFDSIARFGDSILAIKDQFDLYGSLLAAKIRGLVRLCDEADRQVNELDDPAKTEILDALHALWLSAIQLQQDTQARIQQLQQYTTPIQMTIQQVARAVGVENPADVMQLNALTDPLAIPAGTVLNYYKAAA